MDTLLVYINELYGLHLDSFDKVIKGFVSENYILTQNTTQYFLKRYRFEQKDRIKEIHLVKKYFAHGGIPVILPLENKNKDTFFLFKNQYYALFPFIFDKQLEEASLSNVAIVSLGEMLGRIHLLGKDAKLPIKEQFKEWNKKETLKKMESIYLEIKKISNHNDFDRLALHGIEIKKNLIQSNLIIYRDLNLPSNHLIHGDYIYYNVFFNDNDKVSYVFDFEKTSYSPRIYELFMSTMHSFFDKTIQKKDINRAKLYINAYCNIYPVSKQEIKQGLKLFYLKLIHSVWIEEEYYIRKNNRVGEFLKKKFILIEYLSKHYDEFEQELLL